MNARATRNITLGLLAGGASIWAIYELDSCDKRQAGSTSTGYHGGSFFHSFGGGEESSGGSVSRGGFGGSGGEGAS